MKIGRFLLPLSVALVACSDPHKPRQLIEFSCANQEAERCYYEQQPPGGF